MSESDHYFLALNAAIIAEREGYPHTAMALTDLAFDIKISEFGSVSAQSMCNPICKHDEIEAPQGLPESFMQRFWCFFDNNP